MSSPRVRRGGCVTWPRPAWQANPRWMLRTDVVKIEVRRVMDAQVACSVDGFDLALRDPQARQLWRLFEHGGFTPMSRSRSCRRPGRAAVKASCEAGQPAQTRNP